MLSNYMLKMNTSNIRKVSSLLPYIAALTQQSIRIVEKYVNKTHKSVDSYIFDKLLREYKQKNNKPIASKAYNHGLKCGKWDEIILNFDFHKK